MTIKDLNIKASEVCGGGGEGHYAFIKAASGVPIVAQLLRKSTSIHEAKV